MIQWRGKGQRRRKKINTKKKGEERSSFNCVITNSGSTEMDLLEGRTNTNIVSGRMVIDSRPR
jgi:hypothetical protein